MEQCIRIDCQVHFNGSALGTDDWDKVGRQMARDASHGSFGEIQYFDHGADGLVRHEVCLPNTKGVSDSATIVLKLEPSIFPVEGGGLQHLLGVLSDTFGAGYARWGALSGEVRSVRLPFATSKYRGPAHTVREIREAFQLNEGEPLLAFSVKPRVGLGKDDLLRVCTEVLSEGFHIVEVDTRDIGWLGMSDWIEISKAAASVDAKRVTRFSCNLTIPWHKAEPKYRDLLAATSHPRVVKVDVGYEGLGTMQALRDTFGNKDEAPIITCYPIIRNALGTCVPLDTLIEVAALSGADIIYPGGRPSIPKLAGENFENYRGTRSTENLDESGRWRSVQRYADMIERGFPMPTVAGGIHPGELHAYYEWLGPDVAYFLGGAVALHKDGHKHGAALCRKIINHALSSKPSSDLRVTKNLSTSLIKECNDSYNSAKDFDANATAYVSPKALARHLEESSGTNQFSFRTRT
ncbi:MAG: RuBisCO large subunit C-terminal-like domain-containing protein [Myxococcales bacterium]|nr:RuBisCO large subunit C-terminal-like domain-containing protein [Myxococcales bacterium]